MHHLRPTAIAGLLLALVPAAMTLSSCGFDYPTDRVNTIAGGVNNRDADVDALGIRVLATAPGKGRLIGALANNLEESAALESVTSPENLATATFEPVQVAARGGVNLAQDASIPLTGEFAPGDFLALEFGFSTGETVSLNVPVVKQCFQYTQIPSEAAEGGAAEGEAAGAEAEDESHSEDGRDARFDCADQAPEPEGGEH